MKSVLLLPATKNTINSLEKLDILILQQKKISEICLIINLDGYLPNSYPRRWRDIPIKTFECTIQSYQNVIEYLIHVRTVYFSKYFDELLIPILRSLPNKNGFTSHVEIKIHEIFFDLYEVIGKYFLNIKNNSTKAKLASHSININGKIIDLYHRHWDRQCFEIICDNNDLIKMFVTRLCEFVNADFEEIEWKNALVNLGRYKNFSFIYLEDNFARINERTRIFFIGDYNHLSEPYKTEIFSVIKSSLKVNQKIIFGRRDISEEIPFSTYKIFLPRLEKILGTKYEYDFFIFLMLEAEQEVKKRELTLRSNQDLVTRVLINSGLLYYNLIMIINGLKKILITRYDSIIDLTTIDFWYELFNYLPDKERKIFKNLVKNLLPNDVGKQIETISKKSVEIDVDANRIVRKGSLIKIFYNNTDIDFVGGKLVGWKYIEFLISNASHKKKYNPIELFEIINSQKIKIILPQHEEEIQIIDKQTLAESIEKLKTFENLLNSEEIDLKSKRYKIILEEKKKLQKYINANSRLMKVGGKSVRRPKKTESLSSKRRRTINQTIDKVLEPLKEKNPAAYSHFKEYLHRKDNFFYLPPENFRWKID